MGHGMQGNKDYNAIPESKDLLLLLDNVDEDDYEDSSESNVSLEIDPYAYSPKQYRNSKSKGGNLYGKKSNLIL
jgi:hypothetical protein